MSKLNSIQEFYKGKTVFITGGSGFMGKVMIEKLLYSCSEIKEIIVLMRPKRGKSAFQRVEDFEKIPLFHRIMKEKPLMMKKIFPVWGEVSTENLGLNAEHLKRVLETSQIVLHFAASLKLEATLKPNIQVNLMGTKFVLDMCKKMKDLIQIVHLSTAFCCEDQDVLYEKVYDFPHKPMDLIRCAEWMTDDGMEAMQKQVLGSQPNTYTYTKRLSEILVRDEYKNLPICIVRPSIVTPTFREPMPGWVDSLNGPAGVLIAAGKGVLRSLLMDPNGVIEATPCDGVINGIIVIVKYLSTLPEKPKEVPVYNLTIHESRKITNGTMMKYAREIGKEFPPSTSLWYPDGDITQNVFIHTIRVFLFQWIPAYFIDFLLFCFGQKRFMVHVQKRIAVGMEVLQFFTMRKWNFNSKKFEELFDILDEQEQDMFLIDSRSAGDVFEYLKISAIGTRQYCMKDPLSTLPRARLQLKIQYFVHILVQLLFWYFVIKTLMQFKFFYVPTNQIIASIKTPFRSVNDSA